MANIADDSGTGPIDDDMKISEISGGQATGMPHNGSGELLDDHQPKKKLGLLSRLKAGAFFKTSYSIDVDEAAGVPEEKADEKANTKRSRFGKNGRSRSFPTIFQLLHPGKTPSEATEDPATIANIPLADEASPKKEKSRRTTSVPKGGKPNHLLPPIGGTTSLRGSPRQKTNQSSGGDNSFLSALSDSPPSGSNHFTNRHLLERRPEDVLSFTSLAFSDTGEGLSPRDLSLTSFGTAESALPLESARPKGFNQKPVAVQEEKKVEAPPRVDLGGKCPTSKQTGGWISSVTVFLYEGKDLPAMDRNGFSDPFCKFKLGTEKHRSRIAYKTLNPSWMEQFDLFIYDTEERKMEISVWDWDRGVRNDFIGSSSVDLSALQSDKLHDLWLSITDANGVFCGSLHLSIMISEKKLIGGEVKEDSSGRTEVDSGLLEKYDIRNSFTDIRDVGSVTVKVFKGCSLRAADLNGKSDPYCVLQLVNARKQTEVELKTLDPEWNREFTFPVQDVHSCLEITVLDMDQDKKSDFLGRVSIPLLKIHNRERRWYALKDEKLMGRAKGSILLELEFVYNPLRAAIRTINPKEVVFNEVSPKFRRQLFVRNMARMRSILQPFLDIAQYIRSCFNWESRRRSITAFFVYMVSVYMFELWMLPAVVLVFLIKHYLKQELTPTSYARDLHPEEIAEDKNDEESLQDEDEDLEEDPNRIPTVSSRKTGNLVQKMRVAQEQLRTVQNSLGFLADLCERMYNTVHFAVPWLSYFAMLVLVVLAVILYLIPLRVVLLVWGVHKFTKKLRNPNALGNNEVLDFLSRVHTHEEVGQYRELRPRDVPAVTVSGDAQSSDGSTANRTRHRPKNITN